MKPLNLLLTLLSLDAILVSIERYTITTKIILQPYSFLRLHEIVQMLILTLISVIFSFLILKETSNNFETLKTRKGTILATIFFIGMYLYATGNGLHEVASYLFNTFCPTQNSSTLCGSAFFNDYYFGNILYFIGLFLGNIAIIFLELIKPAKTFTKKDITIVLINSFIYAIGLFAYAAFDKVLVGLYFVIIAAFIINVIIILAKKRLAILPFTLYCSFAYTLSAIAALLIKLR